MDNFVLLSGCSGGGKSTLIEALRRRGHRVVEEPGRRIVTEERASGGPALPWVDAAAFARRAIEMALADYEAAPAGSSDWVFFDRGLIDAAVALGHLTGEPVVASLSVKHRYHHRVFLAPPWPEIYVGDADRRHGFDGAVVEYERLTSAYASLDYEIVLLPKASVEARVDSVMATLRGV